MLKHFSLIALALCIAFTSVPPVHAQDTVPPIQRLGMGLPTSIAASPDGKTLAVGSSIGVWLLDTETLQFLKLFETPYWVEAVEYSMDGAYLYVNDAVLDSGSGQPVSMDASQIMWIDDTCSFSGALCANYHPVTLNLYDVEDHIKIVDTNTLIDVALLFGWNPQDIAWSPDGLKLYVLARGNYRDFTIKVWNTTDWKQAQVLKVFAPPQGLCGWYGPELDSCKPLAVHAWWGDIHEYDLETGRLIRHYSAHRFGLSAAKLSADGALMVTSGSNRDDQCLSNYPEGPWMCDANGDSTKVWDRAARIVLVELPVRFDDVVFSPDKTIIIGITSEGLEAWDWRTATRLWLAEGTHGTLCGSSFYTDKFTAKCVAVSPDGRYVATGAGSPNANVVNLRLLSSGELVTSLGGHTRYASSILFSRDGSKIAASSGDGTVLIWAVP